MGKSDPYVFHAYDVILKNYVEKFNLELNYKKGVLLGQLKDNSFTSKIKIDNRKFYDYQLGNWNINEYPYSFENKNDIIICTRCPYFAKDPKEFIQECSNKLKKDGQIFLDWGLGDHLRYDKYRVGFFDDTEHEESYFEGNKLYSCVWDEKFNENNAVKNFLKRIEKYGYRDLSKAVRKEIKSILTIDELEEHFKNVSFDFFTLWEDNPQLYIVVQGVKR